MTPSLSSHILILDGAQGTQIQQLGLTEADFRGERFAQWPTDLRGCNDLLCLTQPDAIASIAQRYVDAGADIISTNTFNATRISMADYGLQEYCREINRAGARIARRVADACSGRKVYVAGSMGPTNKTASMSPDVSDPAYRAVTFDDLYNAYTEQIEGLIEGGVDLLLFETVFDTLNLKAGLAAATDTMERLGLELPVMVSVTISGKSGRTFSGQTLEAFVASIAHAPIFSIGLNCSIGSRDAKPWVRELARISPWPISCHPNAGLPDINGNYSETPELMARMMADLADEGLVNIIGGCCGTTPAHIAAYRRAVEDKKPRQTPSRKPEMHLSGLEMLAVTPEANFIGVGERCNVAGSRKFLRLIKEGSIDEAVAIARHQADDGALILDINMDDGLLDTRAEMCRFLNTLAAEPDIARLPVMIDSSRWDVIEAALKCVQGKPIVNSISLKEGEDEFLRRAAVLRRLGAAVVVMAFDEEGQADTYERKIAVCSRAYRLLTERIGFPAEDIIFDPNILAIATGIETHDRYGLDFIRAVGWIKQNLPGAKVSGGVSNLSFAFRGNNPLREAIHAVFLYHAIAQGMDMAIVNPSMSVRYDDIEPRLRSLIEDVVLCRRPGAAEELTAYATESITQNSGTKEQKTEGWRELPVRERLTHALVHGIADHLEADLGELIAAGADPVTVIDGPLMAGMNRVGQLFGEGKMFLPQVVKTARTMKRAVAILQPEIDRRHSGQAHASAGKILFATVKGDVHDIGKNIVSIVLACNGYEVIDLGVSVSAETIVDTALRERPDIVCLSGLITPSLDEMAHVATLMAEAGLEIPIMVGGATTSRRHTALKIAPHYQGPVIHVPDASQNPLLAALLLNPDTRAEYIARLKAEARAMRLEAEERKGADSLLPLAEARKMAVTVTPVCAPAHPGRHIIDIPVAELIPLINWRAFMAAWSLPASLGGNLPGCVCRECSDAFILSHTARHGADKAAQAFRLYSDATALLATVASGPSPVRGAVLITDAHSDADDNIHIGDTVIPTLRRQSPDDHGLCPALSDMVADRIGIFAVSADLGAQIASADQYRSLLAQTVAHRLAEAGAEWLHRHVAHQLWGYAADDSEAIGIRPAVGYSMLPDQRVNHLLDSLLGMSEIGITLTDNGAMEPSASVSGLIIPSPEARYFNLGPLAPDQLTSYATRRSLTVDEVKKILGL